MDQEYFVYKFSIRDSDYFYIGISKNPYNRMHAHMAMVSGFIRQYRLIPHKARKPNCGYAWMAKQFLRRKKMFYTLGGFKSRDCYMKILYVSTCKHDASIHESKYIQEHILNPYCFNKQTESYYSSKKTNSNVTSKTPKQSARA